MSVPADHPKVDLAAVAYHLGPATTVRVVDLGRPGRFIEAERAGATARIPASKAEQIPAVDVARVLERLLLKAKGTATGT